MSNFKGSTSARFVKNKVKTEYKAKHNDHNSEEFALKNPMLNDSVQKKELVNRIDEIDSIMGFDRIQHGENDGKKPRNGWLVNMHATTIPSDSYLTGYSGVDYYFLDEEGGSFKATLRYDPYFFIETDIGHEVEVEEWLRKFLEQASVKNLSRLSKEDLALANHLVGLKKVLIKLTFHNVSDLLSARRLLSPIIKQNKIKRETRDVYLVITTKNTFGLDSSDQTSLNADPSTFIQDMKEYDVPYHVRVSIDMGIRVGKWYNVYVQHSEVELKEDPDKIAFADPVVLAFDIETTKAPLKFPVSSIDQIMMISYMIDGEGFLITNREIIAEDIDDFEYTPRPEYPGIFTIFNEPDEKQLLIRFFEHIRDAKPTVIATFNGDFFDWPFVEDRSRIHDLDMFDEIGFAKDNEGEYKSKYCVHMDCYRWVKRDSYLPQGSQGLKAVTTAKLGYNPTELDPELMTPYAYEQPQILSEYSVSDAVATYYLYLKYVHPFVFSLCTIIPLNPDEVLRKGTGTLCEMLLSVKATEKNILLPNKHSEPIERFYEGHLIESETYVGGHVESLEAGVFRSDIPTKFKVEPEAVQEILDELHSSIKFCIEVENNKKVEDVVNYDEIYNEIKSKLIDLRDNPVRTENPLIYHVDVASMYPNIMTSNRLQPDSMKSEEDCASCDFNRPGKECDRRLPWSWRGEYYPAEMNEYNMIKRTLQNETFPNPKHWMPPRKFEELSYTEQAALVKKRLSDYSRKVYSRVKQSKVVEREAIICQRENPFYVDTVRSFRDRRYEFKGLAKVWKGKIAKAKDQSEKDEANKMVILYDSLQLAHKVILNSFYGYVMRKGSRWYSMEMAGVTCLTGASIIQMARALVERIGRPLELDTDGIWCILPKTFPENFNLKCKDGKKIFLEYPCSMLNFRVHQKFTNHQYQDLVDPDTFKYKTKSDNSIFFEVDGPYRAMILPTSLDEGRNLKKRYAVFNHDGTLAELKGFELKRRGELRLIKNFQSDIFKLFLEGNTLESCYQAVASVANNWLDVLDTKGGMLEDEDLIELICENRSMSRSLADYGDQKSTSITTAKRLGEFLGAEMVKDAGLATKYIISSKPFGAPITERAIPVAIFSSEKKEHFLKKWSKDPTMDKFGPRDIIDWNYYLERLSSVIQKIISIPAALQDVKNPVPRVSHPDWLQKLISRKEDVKQQSSISNFFSNTEKSEMLKQAKEVQDIEDFGELDSGVSKPKSVKVLSRKRKGAKLSAENAEEQERNEAILNGSCPSMLKDYEGFLIYQKAKWTVQAKSRERRKKLFGSNSETSHRSAIGDIVRKQAENVAGSNWEIIEYKLDPSQPGVVKAYLLINNKIHAFNFHIPRRLFASFKSELSPRRGIQGCELEKSNAILPNGHNGTNLYKLVMPEAVYHEEAEKATSLLNDSNLLGLYETQIGAIERAVIDLGNNVRFDEKKVGALGKGMKLGFQTKDLIRIEDEGYLKRFSMDITYLLHIVTNSYEFFALFKSWDAKCLVFVLKPSASAQGLPPNMDKIYSEIYQAKKEKFSKYYNIIDYSENMEFEYAYYSESQKLNKKLNQVLGKLQESRSSMSLVALQSLYPNKVVNMLSALKDVPIIKMNIRELSLPAVGWQSLITKRLINHYFALAAWISNLISLARYGNVPLCNLHIENIGYLIDIEYARRLTTNNVVLWWSSSSLPDHGGFEMDTSPDYENLTFPQINNPEIYETACLEVEIGTLTINTILTSLLINEAEGSDLVEDSVSKDINNGSSIMAEDSFSSSALGILRAMVKDWWEDAMKNNINADSMMNNLVTWVQRKDSYLYDYSLHYHVYNLTSKALLQLIGEFKRMNAQVVFANRNKMIVQTNKISVENSYAYGQYMLKAIRSKPLFNFLELGIIKYWDTLIWMDEYNYGGRCCTEITSDEVQDLLPVNTWQIKNYLPIIFQNEFDDWIIIFLDAITKHKVESLLGGPISGSPRKTQIAHILNGQKKHELLEVEEEDLSSGVMEMFRKPLQKRMDKLYHQQNEAILNPEFAKEYEFPKLAGSHLNLKNPCLELVKFLCAIFSLSSKRSIEVRVLRQELLSIFWVKEFSPQAEFKYPSASLKLLHVSCDYCNYIRDIDICRDSEESIWNCASCNNPYNKVSLEEQMVANFQKLVTKFYQQDYKCDKCKQIRSSNLSLHCKCSGNWVETINHGELEKKIGIFSNVAKLLNLHLLSNLLEEVA